MWEYLGVEDIGAEYAAASRDDDPGDRWTPAALRTVVRVGVALGGASEAFLALAERSAVVHERAFGPASRDAQRARYLQSRLLQTAERHREAEAVLRALLPAAEEALGPDHVDVVDYVGSLGVLLMRLGRVDEAEPLMLRDLGSTEAREGPSGVDTAIARNNLAALRSAQGDEASALALHAQNLAILRERKGDDDPRTLTASSNVALGLLRTGRAAEAAAVAADTWARRRRRLGPEHPDTLTNALVFSNAELKCGRAGAAIASAREGTACASRRFGDRNATTISALLVRVHGLMRRSPPDGGTLGLATGKPPCRRPLHGLRSRGRGHGASHSLAWRLERHGRSEWTSGAGAG